jgi:dolichol-phosphate mannosyltransferase
MISVVFPVYNEKENLPVFITELLGVMDGMGGEYELIGVDDGSDDGSVDIMRGIAEDTPRLRVIVFRHNFGQTAALAAGVAAARGDIVVTIDSDLENNPADIPRLVGLLGRGYQAVSGWRRGRWDGQMLTRKLPSVVANRLISAISGLRLHDYGCTLKAYRREGLAAIPLYGEMHRFIPAYMHWRGGRVAEVPVGHRPRIHGRSNYGISRMYRVILDLLLIKFLTRYMNRPIHFFGGIGLLSLVLGAGAGVWAVALKIISGTSIIRTPLPVLAALFLIVGVQLIVMGILAEVMMRTYYESQKKTPYDVKERINFQA